MTATITNLFLKLESGRPMKPVESVHAVAGRGFQGDIAFGRERRQVLIVDRGVVDEFGLQAGDLRENLTVRDLDFDSLKAGSLLRIGDCSLVVQGECAPCSKLDDLQSGLQDAIRSKRGLLASVVEGGKISVGDPITAEHISMVSGDSA